MHDYSNAELSKYFLQAVTSANFVRKKRTPERALCDIAAHIERSPKSFAQTYALSGTFPPYIGSTSYTNHVLELILAEGVLPASDKLYAEKHAGCVPTPY